MIGPLPRGRCLLGLILLASSVSVACGSGRGTVVTASPGPTLVPMSPVATVPVVTPTRPVVTPTQGGGIVPPELIGTWMQDNVGASTFYFIRKAYSFAADGTYALIDMLCSQTTNGTNCQQDESPEEGVATVAGNQLSLSPTTQSDEGPRTLTFAVVRDPNMGDLRLQFYTPTYVDEWFWVEP